MIGHLHHWQDAKWLENRYSRLPASFVEPVGKRYAAIFEKNRNHGERFHANSFLRELVEENPLGHFALAESNEEICAAARAMVERVFRLAGVWKDVQATIAAVSALVEPHGIVCPDMKKHTPAAILKRLTDEAWWRRALRRHVGRSVEGAAINIGLVHRRAGCYASDGTVARRTQQKARNRALLASIIATNEQGQAYTLEELAALSVANPAIRRGELMMRIAGFEQIARDLGHVGEFYTLTAPSRFHARLSASCHENPKYSGATPKEAQAYLCAVWARIRAAAKRRGLDMYGFRVAEAHHDGTPHWHLLLFVNPAARAGLRALMARYAVADTPGELGIAGGIDWLRASAKQWQAIAPRFKAVAIDWGRGSAAGYIAKYIAKNIDAHGVDVDLEGRDAKDSAGRVDAWASCWGIRQFQQIGGAPVTVWRELRRLDASAWDGAIGAAAALADGADWAGFVRLMGGAAGEGRERAPVRVFREEMEGGKYGDMVKKIVGILAVDSGEVARTHEAVWILSRGAPARPWSSVNNCTEGEGNEKSGGVEAIGKPAGAAAGGGRVPGNGVPVQRGQVDDWHRPCYRAAGRAFDAHPPDDGAGGKPVCRGYAMGGG
jgi:hypothetical protein